MANAATVPRPGALPAPSPWPGQVRRWWPDRRGDGPDAIDVALAVVSFAASTVPTALTRSGSREGSVMGVVLFGALAAAPLIIRRRRPLTVLACVAAVHCVASLIGLRFTPFVSNAGPMMAVAVVTVADRCPRRVSLAAATAVLIATALAAGVSLQLYGSQDQDFVQFLVIAPALLLGDTVHMRRDYRRRLASEVRREAFERERRIRAEERLRVSRDVHDVVSHTLSMIAVRSGVARLLLDEQPDEARAALTVIETTSRSALDEVRRVLRQTRQAPGELPGAMTSARTRQPGPAVSLRTRTAELADPAPVEPTELAEPTLADLDPLIASLGHAGFEVTYRDTGDRRHYSPILETSGYRIVQEALTNVVKHATGATRAEVEVCHAPRELVISVVDDGRAACSGDGPGLGLVGMRERAELFDGSLTAGVRPTGGFAVVARFPVTGRPDDRFSGDQLDGQAGNEARPAEPR